eukprot:8237195-Heterocapsa_arctica.AAC.1
MVFSCNREGSGCEKRPAAIRGRSTRGPLRAPRGRDRRRAPRADWHRPLTLHKLGSAACSVPTSGCAACTSCPSP